LQREVAGDEEPIREWPLSLQGVLELKLAAARHTDRLAQLDAINRVIRDLEGMGGRTLVRISFGDDGSEDRVERFWDSGAFGALRDTLFLLERLSPERDPRRQGFERLQAGGRALVHGDPEAALSHAVLAAASILDVPLADVPAQAAERTLEGPAWRPFTRQIFERAIELVRAAADGRPNAAVALFLAPTALRATEALLHGPLPGRNLSGPELADLIDAENPLESIGDA
jgi:hypothetical protein